jgi:hypothetical protein
VASAAGFMTGLAIAIVTKGPSAPLAGLLLGFMATGYGMLMATVPALVLGSLLWLRRVRSTIIWASMGALAGLACLRLATIVLEIDEASTTDLGLAPSGFVPIFMAVGAISALLFRVLMRVFSASDEALSAGSDAA